MKYLLVVLLFAAISCQLFTKKPPKKKYYVVVATEEKSYTDNTYSPGSNIDSVLVESDSLAYWEGVKLFTASLRSMQLLEEKGVAYPPYRAKSFDVLNEDGFSVLDAISPQEKQKATKYTEKHL